MTKRERVTAALRGEPVDRVPVATWVHFPRRDGNPVDESKSILDYQRTYDWDFIKLMMRSTTQLEDWGLQTGDYHPEGYLLTTRYAINVPEDWTKLKVLDPHKGSLGQALETIRLVKKNSTEDVFKLATIFSPFMIARMLAWWGRESEVTIDLDAIRTELHAALEVFTETDIRYAKACLENGADGIYFAESSATTDFMTEKQFHEFIDPYDRRILDALEGKSSFTMLHICSEHIMFDKFLDYPVHALNWSDRTTPPTLKEARKKTDKCLSGGLAGGGHLNAPLVAGTSKDVEREAMEAFAMAGSRKYLLTTGCSTAVMAKPENLHAFRSIAEKMKGT